MVDIGRILAVDPGEKRLGLAISDPTETIASPLLVIPHVSMLIDSGQIAQIAAEQKAVKIVVGQAMGSDGEMTPAAKHALKLAEAIKTQTELEVILWDESGSTEIARDARISLGVNRKRRSGHMDDLAAVVILQSYLDATGG